MSLLGRPNSDTQGLTRVLMNITQCEVGTLDRT